MDGDSIKKLIVAVIVAITVAITAGWIALFAIVGHPSVAAIVFAIIGIAVIIAMIYYGIQRIKEINEGMDNDTDNY